MGWKTLDGKWDGKQCFPLFGKQRKIGTDGEWDGLFSTRAHNYFPPKSGGKLWRENVLTVQLLDCPLPTSTNSSTAHPYSSNHIKIHQTHIQIHINNQSEIEKRRRRRRRKKEEDAEEDAKITIFSTQNFCFLCPKSLPLIKPNPKSSSIIKA